MNRYWSSVPNMEPFNLFYLPQRPQRTQRKGTSEHDGYWTSSKLRHEHNEGIVRVVNNYHPSASSAVSAGDKNKLKGSMLGTSRT